MGLGIPRRKGRLEVVMLEIRSNENNQRYRSAFFSLRHTSLTS
jgi:hypothetical protein